MLADNPNTEVSEKENKLKMLAEEINDYEAFRDKLFKLYIEEFEDFIGPILLVKETDFMRSFNQRIRLIIQEMYSNEAFELSTFVQMINETEKRIFEECYKKSFTILSKGWSDLEKNVHEANKKSRMTYGNLLRINTAPEKHNLIGNTPDANNKPAILIPSNSAIIYLKNFRKHCKQNETANHKCKGRFIPIFDGKNLTHVICVNCKYSFFSSSILMYCNDCQKEFYSYYVSNFDKECQPATWDKYHCGAVVNDQMKCLKCKEKFFIKLNDGKLLCKSCKFEADPLSIVWQCVFCKKDFRCKAKIYNPMEYKLMKMAIKNALLFKIQIWPTTLPCCNGDPSQLNFYHKAECKGTLYTSELAEKKVIVCNSCKAICHDSKFIWTCPLCMKTFQSESIKKKFPVNDDVSFKTSIDDNRYAGTEKNFIPNEPIHSRESSQNRLTKNFSLNVNKYQEHFNDPEEEIPNSSKLRGISFITPQSGFEKFKNSYKRKTVENSSQLLTPRCRAAKTFSIINPAKKAEIDLSGTIGQKEDAGYNRNSRNRATSSMSRSQKIIEKEEILGKGYKHAIPLDSKIITPSNREDVKDVRDKLVNDTEKIDNDSLQSLKNRETTISPGVESNKNSISGKLKEFDFEDYTVVTQIGEGSFGKIYLVEDANKTVYSMKKIIVNDECEVEFIIQEYELVNQLRHSHILRIISLCRRQLDETTFIIYILMEVSLSDWEKEIKARHEMKQYYSEKELIAILKQLVSALAFLQKKNISHRDIKPQNILLFRDSIFKIADFGEAKQLSQMELNKEFSTLRGTELYMSPILFSALRTNQKDIKHNPYKSDVFSLGFCVLYAATLSISALYDCRNIYDSKSIAGYLKKILQVRYSRQFIDLLAKMMKIEEQNRYDFLELEEMMEDMDN